jgi:SAM-dependent methyltransferase
VSDLPFTGERFVPGTPGEIWIEHWHRYHFARRWAAGKRVVDVACGEGYGSALLAHDAAQVTGVDVSRDAVAHAQRTYPGVANLRFVEASCTALPLDDASVDLVVSFETLEHIEPQERFLDEIARVLAPGGVLLLSSPDRVEYSEKRDFRNEFHVKELDRGELESLVRRRFPAIEWYGQRATFYSVIAPERPAMGVQVVEVDESDPSHAGDHLSAPLYFLLAASREPEALRPQPPVLGLLADRGDWVHRDYEKVMRWLTECAAQRDELVAARTQQQAALDASRDRERALEAQAREAREQAARAEAELKGLRASSDRLRQWAESLQGSLAQARRARSWLRWPFVRLGMLTAPPDPPRPPDAP